MSGAVNSSSSLPPLQTSINVPFVSSSDSFSRESPVASRNSPASRQSFTTAFTSSKQATPVTTENTDLRTTLPSSSTSLGLRKSLSVDSFAQYGRDAVPKATTRPNRGHTSSGHSPLQGSIPDATARLRQESEIIKRSTQLRNSIAESDHFVLVDPDLERSDPLHLLGERGKRLSSRGIDRSKAPVRAGELPLPARTSTLSLASNISTTSGSSSNHWDYSTPRLQTASSMQSMSRRSISSFVGNQTGRARSGSLGVYVTQSGKPILVNTRISTRDTSSPNSEITLAIVGAAGCGKTTVIRKGLKSYGLSEATVFYVASAPIDIQGPPRYTRRIGRVTQNENTPDCALHVFEVLATHPHCDLSAKQTFWPDGAPRLDGGLLHGYRALKLPTVVLACKSDLDRQVEPQKALEVLLKYDVGLVEVANNTEGKEKMRRSFDWLLKAIYRERRSIRSDVDSQYRNPASPDVLMAPPLWENSRTTTPTLPSPVASVNTVSQSQLSSPRQSSVTAVSTSRGSLVVNSPTRTRSMGDLLTDYERSKNRDWQSDRDTNGITNPASSSSFTRVDASTTGGDDAREEHHESKEKEFRPTQWATLEELLDKLLFLAVSGDDPAYISHFLLTYRRFASPRSVLLAMQKRMRQLDNPSGDPMFACFAQMRICGLLETWVQDYPYDFAVRGTAGALSALIKSIIGKTYLLHYGSDFLPFLEVLPNLVDKDAAWSIKPDDIADENDDSYSLGDDDEEVTPIAEIGPSDSDSPSPTSLKGMASLIGHALTSKSILPSSAKGLPLSHVISLSQDGSELSIKQLCRELVKVAHEVNSLDPDEIAQEVTRIGAKMFLDIEPRHWLQYTCVSGKKDTRTCSIAGFNEFSNHLADWVVSLILCHDRPKSRAKQIEKFADVAQKLRALNNYSALRAFVAGINNSTFPGDDTMEVFISKSPEQAKNLRSWDLLLQHIRSHRAYRMALKNSKGACIPALEVHISDLIRAHEGNLDVNIDMPGKVHWGKYNMIGKFISNTNQCQAQCRDTNDYDFPDRQHIRNLIVMVPLMSTEVQKSRIAPPPADPDLVEDQYRTQFSRIATRDANPAKDPLLRKFMFWS